MTVFKNIINRGHEQVVYFNKPEVGLRAIIAIHNTVLGPALGGCRMWNYRSEEEALIDVLRLSRGMTYKAAIAGLNLGGGKAVIIGDSKKEKSENLFRSFGRFVEGLGGRYITAEDVGTSVRDMEHVRVETDYVTGITRALGGSGDPSYLTSYGVYIGMQAAIKHRMKLNSLSGLKISLQGLGHVGISLAEYLHKDGAELFVSDIDELAVDKAVDKYGATKVGVDEIYDLDVDIYAPCALGATINDETISRLNCKIVAGAANNVLKDGKKHGLKLKEKNILYAPDYAINAGGLINVSNELEGYNQDKAYSQAEGIYDTLMGIFSRSDSENISTNAASDRQAEDRIKKIGDLKSFYLPYKKSFNVRSVK